MAETKEDLINIINTKITVYRRSYRYFSKWNKVLTAIKLITGASALSALSGVYALATLSLIPVIIEIIEKQIKIGTRLSEYKMACKHYMNYKCNLLKKSDIPITRLIQQFYDEELKLLETLKFFPREKYLKELKLNGYAKEK